MDEEEEVEVDYSRLFDTSPPQVQVAAPFDGFGPSNVLSENLSDDPLVSHCPVI